MILLSPAIGLPVNAKYLSNIPITARKAYPELAHLSLVTS
jgi:hypothetical protein